MPSLRGQLVYCEPLNSDHDVPHHAGSVTTHAGKEGRFGLAFTRTRNGIL